MAQGIKKGIKKGIAEGRAEGAAQGRAEGVDQTLNALLAAAAPFLPPERIEELRLQRDPVAIAFAIADARR
jgi:flagellar biosynthesis/type III secretory pathway protein FliH